MSRLTNYDREDICRKLMKKRFYAEVKAMAHEAAELMDKVVHARFTEEEHAIVNNLPPKWLKEDNTFYVNILGEREYHYSNGTTFVGPLYSVLRLDATDMPSRGVYRFTHKQLDRQAVVLDKDHPLTAPYKDLQLRVKNLTRTMEQAKSEINVLLRSCSSVKKLITTWPEVEPFVPDYLLHSDPKAPRANLPATYIAQLNTTLALP